MTPAEIQERLSQSPSLYQGWVSAVPIGKEDGILYLSSIHRAEESVGTVHVHIWGKNSMGDPVAARKAAIELMRAESLDRLVGEIDSKNRLAINWAKSVGFNVVGTVRRRKDAHGGPHDVVLFDALPEDLWE